MWADFQQFYFERQSSSCLLFRHPQNHPINLNRVSIEFKAKFLAQELQTTLVKAVALQALLVEIWAVV